MSILNLKRTALAASMESMPELATATAFKSQMSAFELAALESNNNTEFAYIDSLRTRLTSTVKIPGSL